MDGEKALLSYLSATFPSIAVELTSLEHLFSYPVFGIFRMRRFLPPLDAAAKLAAGRGKKIRVAIGMSGGVDSSVAALLLKETNLFDLRGIFMDNWDPSDEEGAEACRATRENDYSDARSVCSKLGIPIERVSFQKGIGIPSLFHSFEIMKWEIHQILIYFATAR